MSQQLKQSANVGHSGDSRWKGLGLVLMVALAARVVIMIPQARRGLDDPDNYVPLARSLAEGRGFALNGHPTAYRPPLYPVLLAPLARALGSRLIWGVFALHLLLGSGTVLLTYLAARRWGLEGWPSLLAALVVAADPTLVVQGRSVMTETLAAFLVAGALASLAGAGRRAAARGGAWLGLAALCRPSLLAGAVLIECAAGLVRPGAWPARLGRLLIGTAMLVVVMSPWAIRNTLIFGVPVWTTTHGGYTLALANNPNYYADVLNGPAGAVWSGPNQKRWFDWVNEATAGASELAADQYLRGYANAFITTHPSDFTRAAIARLGRLWGLAPSGAVYPLWLRVLTAAWTLPLWIMLVAGLLRPSLWLWPRIAAPLMLVGLSAVHAFYWTDLRMRAPLVPAIALVAAWGMAAWGSRWGASQTVTSMACKTDATGQAMEDPNQV